MTFDKCMLDRLWAFAWSRTRHGSVECPWCLKLGYVGQMPMTYGGARHTVEYYCRYCRLSYRATWKGSNHNPIKVLRIRMIVPGLEADRA